MSGLGPEVLFQSNQKPERVSIPTFISFKKGHTFQTRYILFFDKINHSTLLQTSRSTWSKLKRITLGPLWLLRPFTVGLRWTNHANLSLEDSHYIFLNDLGQVKTTISIWVQQYLQNPSPQTSHPQGGASTCDEVFRNLGI